MGLDTDPFLECHPAKRGPQILKGRDAHPEAEGNLEQAVAAARFFHAHLLVIDGHIDAGKGHIPLRIEIEDEILRGDDLLSHQHPLSGINPAELSRLQQTPLYDEAL